MRKMLMNKPAKGINQTATNGLMLARADTLFSTSAPNRQQRRAAEKAMRRDQATQKTR